MKLSSILLACAAAPLALGALAPQAHAQGATGAPAAVGLEEIIVTANRREQRLQDVPIAITAISGASAEAHRVVDLQTLTTAVPALTMTRQANSVTPFLRGVGSQTGSLGVEPTVALYVDNVYLATGLGSLFDFNNIDRVEVLRGPQGTLFGRNAVGGVIHVMTKNPTQEPSMDVNASYANYNTVTGNFYGTTGITDNLAANLALHAMKQHDGWGTNLATGGEAYTSSDYSGRAKLLWTPGDSTRVLIAGDYDRFSGDAGIGRQPQPGTFGPGAVPNRGFYNLQNNPESVTKAKQYGFSAQVDQDMGAVNLTAITAWRKLTGFALLDNDATPAFTTGTTLYSHFRSFSQEVQLKSAADSKINWIVGGFYFYTRAGLHPLAVSVNNGAVRLRTDSSARTESLAGFAQVTAEVLPGTNLTGGIRYTHDNRTLGGVAQTNGAVTASRQLEKTFNKVTFRASLDHRFSEQVLAYASFNRGFKSGLVASLDNITSNAVNPEILDAYEAGIKTDLLDRRLRVNLSAFYYDYKDLQVSQLLGATAIVVNAGQARIKGLELEVAAAPTSTLSINAGATLLDGKYTQFSGGPHFSPNGAPPTCANIPFPANSPGGQTQVPGGCNLKGNDTINTPPFSANISVTQRIPLATGELDLNGTYAYNDGFFFEADNSVKQKAYTLLGASIGWTAENKGWGVRVWGQNLLNEKIFAAANSGALGKQYSAAPPRTYGVTVSASFN